MPLKHLEDVFKICLQDVLRTSSALTIFRRQDVLEEVKLLRWRRAEDVLKTNKCLLGCFLYLIWLNVLEILKSQSLESLIFFWILLFFFFFFFCLFFSSATLNNSSHNMIYYFFYYFFCLIHLHLNDDTFQKFLSLSFCIF